jgi:16S rRNA (cytosine967-C5)-methyltransferase
VGSNLERLGLRARLQAADAAVPDTWWDGKSFDRVLVDAPCSGTGTLRHNPEIRWRLNDSDIAQLAAKQKQILKHAAAVVRVGGRFLYSTCSIEKDENEAVVSDFLKNNRTFARAKLEAAASLITEDGAARTWPHRDDVEGFFVAAFERTNDLVTQ